MEDLPGGVEVPTEIDWFPERAWGGRVWMPCSARAEGSEGALELFGHVSYVQPPGGEPDDFQAKADFTDVLAEDNPDWKIDLDDDVIGRWRGENGRAGAVTLVWGRPLLRGAVAVTAELDAETVDQEAISRERFTLIALDALEGYGDDIFMRGEAVESPRPGAGFGEPLCRLNDLDFEDLNDCCVTELTLATLRSARPYANSMSPSNGRQWAA